MGHREPRTRKWSKVFAAPAVGLLLVVACGAVFWSAYIDEDPPLVAWPEASPESEGFDGEALERLAADLAGRNTKALLVARHGRIVFEWYATDFGPNRRYYTAAMAKGTAAVPALIALAHGGFLSLDDRVATWVPSWRDDPTRAKVRLRDLATHRSGLENIAFDEGAAGRLGGWRQRYYDNPGERFRLALDSAEFRFAPATSFGYSGVGYYVLSYVMGRALQSASSSARGVPAFLSETVYGPLGIPPEAWSIGYSRSDTVEGIALTHLGSGGEITARAAARIGQLFVQGGCYKGRQLVDAGLVQLALGEAGARPVGDEGGAETPVSVAGWWRGSTSAWPSLPATAAAAVGAGHKVVLIDPALDLVVVRLGGDLSGGNEPFYAALDRYVFGPLYDALTEEESARGQPLRPGLSGVASSRRAGADAGESCSD